MRPGLFLLLVTILAGGADALGPDDIAKAIALGRTCRAPIVTLSRPSSDFVVYIETAFARAALVAATATMMSEPLDSRAVQHAMNVEGVRAWTTRRHRANAQVAVTALRLESKGRIIRPVAERDVRLFVGTVPSHGIIEPLRARFPEYTFASLPSGRFEVVVQTTVGMERYAVTPEHQAALLKVCNERR